jgi:hypothetical protein
MIEVLFRETDNSGVGAVESGVLEARAELRQLSAEATPILQRVFGQGRLARPDAKGGADRVETRLRALHLLDFLPRATLFDGSGGTLQIAQAGAEDAIFLFQDRLRHFVFLNM